MNALAALQKAHGQYRALTPEQRKAYHDGRVHGSKTIGAWLDFLAPLAQIDLHADIFRSGWQVLLFGIFLFPIVMFASMFHIYLAFAIAAATGLPLVIYAVMWLRVGRRDLANDLRHLVIPFLEVLREDLPAEAPVLLDLALPPLLTPSNRVSSTPPYRKGNYSRCIDSVYASRWFRGSAMLADKSRIKWAIADKAKVTEKQKRNPRGKVRTRNSISTGRRLALRISFPTKQYGAPSRSESMVIDRGATRTTLRSTRQMTLFQTRNNQVIQQRRPNEELQFLIAAIGDAYRHVTKTALVNRLAEPQKHPAPASA